MASERDFIKECSCSDPQKKGVTKKIREHRPESPKKLQKSGGYHITDVYLALLMYSTKVM